MRVWLWGHDRKTGDEMYFSTAGERLLQELKLMEALPEEPQRIKSALAVRFRSFVWNTTSAS